MKKQVLGRLPEEYYHNRFITNISGKKLRHVRRQGRSNAICQKEELISQR
jgi:hypothetical protein